MFENFLDLTTKISFGSLSLWPLWSAAVIISIFLWISHSLSNARIWRLLSMRVGKLFRNTFDVKSRDRMIRLWFVPKYSKIFSLIYNTTGLLAILLVGFAMLRPRWGMRIIEEPLRGKDILFVVDVSLSMFSTDISPSRIERAKQFMLMLAESIPGNRMGIVAFSGDAFLLCPFTSSRDSLLYFIQNLEPGLISARGTNFELALKTGSSLFDPETASEKILVLITDGEQTDGDAIDAVEKLSTDTVLYTIGVGSASGGNIIVPVRGKNVILRYSDGRPVISRLDEKILKEMAVKTGGKYFNIGHSMAAVFALQKDFSSKTGDKQGVISKKVYEEQYVVFILPLIFLFFVEKIFRFVLVFRRRKSGGSSLTAYGKTWTAGIFIVVSTAVLLFHRRALHADSLNDARRHFEHNEYNASERALQKMLGKEEYADRKGYLYYNLGLSYFQQRKYTEASQAFLRAYDWADRKGYRELAADSAYNGGLASIHVKDYKNAFIQWKKSLQWKSLPDIRKNMALLQNLTQQRQNRKKSQRQQRKQSGKGNRRMQPEDSQNQSDGQKKPSASVRPLEQKPSEKESRRLGSDNRQRSGNDQKDMTPEQARRILDTLSIRPRLPQVQSRLPESPPSGKEW